MSLFKDEKYEELDWISQAVEPIQTELAIILEQLPDLVEYDAHQLTEALHNRNTFINTHTVILRILQQKSITLKANAINCLESCFQIDCAPNTTFHAKTMDMIGHLRVIKTTHTIDQDLLTKTLGKDGLDMLSSLWAIPHSGIARLNELAEIIGDADMVLKTRGSHKKVNQFLIRVKKLFETNEWNIKDYELANRVHDWMYRYIVDGNLAAMNNFCRLKVMTHKGVAIYSLNEEAL